MGSEVSATQKIMDERLKEKGQTVKDNLKASLCDKTTCGTAHQALVEHSLHLSDLDELTHAGQQDIKKDIKAMSGEVGTLSGLVRSSNGHVATIKKGWFKGLPTKYVFATGLALGLFAIGMSTVIIIYSLATGHVKQLTEGINDVRGKARTIQPSDSREAVAKVKHK